jgi:hypothetical protein
MKNYITLLKNKNKRLLSIFENNLELNPKGLLKRFISKPKTTPRIIDLCLDTWIIVIGDKFKYFCRLRTLRVTLIDFLLGY